MLLIAHRGDRRNFLENTIEAFQSAIEHQADGIEFDVQVQHGVPIIVHDYLYDQSLQYPTFAEVLEKFSGKTRVEIEVKSFSSDDVDIVADAMKSFSIPKLEITSSVHPILPYIRKKFPDPDLGSIFPDKLFEDWMTDEFIVRFIDGYMRLTGAKVVHLPPSLYSEPVISALKGKGYLLHHHIKSRDVGEYERLLGLGIDIATFDDINLLRNVRQSDS